MWQALCFRPNLVSCIGLPEHVQVGTLVLRITVVRGTECRVQSTQVSAAWHVMRRRLGCDETRLENKFGFGPKVGVPAQ